MAIKLIIDGYNLIKSTYLVDPEKISNLESSRKFLIEKLAVYKKIKCFPITVVFDGGGKGDLQESKEDIKGVRIIFSRQGEKADSVIERITSDRGEGFVVVTSDRLLAKNVRRNKAAAISSPDFVYKLKMARYREIKGLNEEDEDDHFLQLQTKKRGNPKKTSKKIRREKSRLDKL
jgi:hypothetical protein